MARIRTIKPTHWADKELPKISLQAHLLWIALWNFSDDDGVFEGDTLLIKSQVFPRRTDIRTEQVQVWLDQLVKARFILPFTYKNEGYYLHRTFKAHQRIDKPQPSLIPNNVINAVVERSQNVLGTVPPVEYSNSKVEVKEGSSALGAGEGDNQQADKPPEQSATGAPPGSAPPPKATRPKPVSMDLKYPWDTGDFKEIWELWKDYKFEQFKFTYKGFISEQSALMELAKMANGVEDEAYAVIRYTMANGWKGFVKPKTDEQRKPTSKKGVAADQADYERELASRIGATPYQSGQPPI